MAKRANKVQEQETITDIDQIVPTFEESHPGESIINDEQELDASGRKKKVDLTMESLLEQGLKNKSQVIRYLDANGYSRSAIANFLGVRYQHVRNVLVTPLKKG
jgi:DNA-directed RNA polymerase specialized sigma24 family protein